MIIKHHKNDLSPLIGRIMWSGSRLQVARKLQFDYKQDARDPNLPNYPIENGETVYGLVEFPLSVYLDYELTRIKLDFASEKKEINYSFAPISKKEKKEFYKNNTDLFTRYGGDKFRFKEVDMIVEKKIREEQFENEIKNILHKFD